MNGFTSRSRARIAAGVLAAVAAALVTAGCGSSSATGHRLSAAASLKRAAYVSAAASGYKLAMTMSETISGLSSGQKLTVNMTANGSFSPASRLGEVTISAQVPTSSSGGTQSLEMQVVLDRDTMYMRLPATLTSQIPGGKPWVSMNLAAMGKAAGISGLGSLLNSSSTLSSPGQYLDYLRAVSDGSVKDLGQQPMDGREVTHYQADLDLAKLPDAVPAADRPAVERLIAALQKKGVNTQMPVDAWIDSSHLIRRLHITYNMSVSTGQSVAMDITEAFRDYGPQPAPMTPSPSETTNLLSLMHGSLTTQTG